MIALYRKELRSIWPLGLLTALVMSGDILYRPLVERLDELAWEDIASYLEPGDAGGFGWVLIVLCFTVAYSAFVREHDERTIELLYALPLRRGSIFVSKVAAGLTVLGIPVAFLLVSDAAQSAFNPQSFGGGHWRADVAFPIVFVHLAFTAIIYAHGLLASVLRRFGLIPYVLVLFMAGIVEDAFPPAAWIDPSELLVSRYAGSAIVIPWTALIAHSTVAFFVFILAYGFWMGPADRIGDALIRFQKSLPGRLTMGCISLIGFGFLALIGIAISIAPSLDDEGGVDLGSASFETAEQTSDRYIFTYPVSHEARAFLLIAEADRLHVAVQARLGTDQGPRLIADMTDTSSDHLGIASWTHVRVGLVAERDPVRLQRTFAHETAHAFQHRLSDRRQGSEGNATRFFAEGSAEWIALEVVPDDEVRDHARTMAAAAWERHRMTSADLIDDQRLHARFDTTLVYTLGEVWTAALVDVCEERAIGDVLRAMAAHDAPRGLGARAFWESRLRAIECDYESVDARFVESLDALAEARRAEIDRIPRISGGVAGRQGSSLRIVARLDRDAPTNTTFVVGIRSAPDDDDTAMMNIAGDVSRDDPRLVEFLVPRVIVPSRRFQLKFAMLVDGMNWGWSETWQWASDR